MSSSEGATSLSAWGFLNSIIIDPVGGAHLADLGYSYDKCLGFLIPSTNIMLHGNIFNKKKCLESPISTKFSKHQGHLENLQSSF